MEGITANGSVFDSFDAVDFVLATDMDWLDKVEKVQKEAAEIYSDPTSLTSIFDNSKEFNSLVDIDAIEADLETDIDDADTEDDSLYDANDPVLDDANNMIETLQAMNHGIFDSGDMIDLVNDL